MNIVVSFKVVPDDQDIQIGSDRSLDTSKAPQTISTYDLNAIEAAVQLAQETGGSLKGLSVGTAAINDSKLKKNALARGIEELHFVADDAYCELDAYATAKVLACALKEMPDVSLVMCGDGSSDNYAQQTDVQLAEALGFPLVTAVSKITPEGNALLCERTLEEEIQVVRVNLPAVVSVVPDIAAPRIPGMKDILAAGKKPMHIESAVCPADNTLISLSCAAPEQADRKQDIRDFSADGALESFAAALKASR
ncbi:MAG: electron transfer flavoprotein [Raoultibacter sp.]